MLQHQYRLPGYARALVALVALVATLASGACAIPTESYQARADRVIVLAGYDQTAEVLTQLPEMLVVRVRDQRGEPMGGIDVVWEVETGGGTIDPGHTTTDGRGEARAEWTLGSAVGKQTSRANVSGAFTTFAATAIPSVSTIEIGGLTTQLMVNQALPFRATLRDGDGNEIIGRPVVWSSASDLVATVSPEGIVRGGVPGVTEITAVAGGKTGRVTVSVHQPFIALDAGGNFTCGLRTGGAAYCWGVNVDGQLGTGNTVSTSLPVLVTGGHVYTSISSNQHSCALTNASLVYCWGNNHWGEVGDGTRTGKTLTPSLVLDRTFLSVTGNGQLHSCGYGVDGTVYCWGLNGQGQLGSVLTVPNSVVPVGVAGSENYFFTSVSSGVNLTAGRNHTCARSASGGVYCWGGNEFGQLGDGTTTDHSSPAPVSLAGVLFSSVIAGSEYKTCALATSGTAYCWGNNAAGQLGNGNDVSQTAPVAVSGGLSFASLSPGWAHTCGVTPDGAVYCWGGNYAGQIGDGTTMNRFTPVRVLLPVELKFSAVSAGDNHSCALSTVGSVYCWGFGELGQLGQGALAPSLVPVQVRLP